MCGLGGGIGAGVDPRIIRALMILNESRGKDAIGFFNAKGSFWKHAERATVELRDRRCTRWIEDSAKKTWAVCGHTRAGTRGGAVTKNAHPFEYGEVIGSHNGTIPDAPKEYSVDTEWAIDLLSKSEAGDYQTALGDVSGWYVLTWLDQRNGCIYLLNWEGSLHLTLYKGTWYYSSEADHLRTAIGAETKIAAVAQGDVVRFHWDPKRGVVCTQMPKFTGKPRYKVTQQTDYTNYHQQAWQQHHPPKVLGDARPRNRPVIVDPLLPSGFITRFPSGIWYAQLLNNKFRMLVPQQQLNELHRNVGVGEYKFMRPGEVRSKLTAISPSTPITDAPPGFRGPPNLLAKSEALAEIGNSNSNAEKKSDQTEGDTTFPTEEEQERREAEAVKASTIDRDGKVIEAIIEEQQQRFSYLTEELDLTKEEATRVMGYEGYFSPGVGAP